MYDSTEEMICPACGKPMKKILVKEANVNVDICLDGCGGIFFDNREVEKFDELHENADEILNAIKGKSFSKVDESLVRECPSCGTNMTKIGAANGQIEIDVCNVCGSKFLDNCELQVIRENSNSRQDSVNSVFASIYQEDWADVIGDDNFVKRPNKTSPRRQFFENLVSRFMW